jgi:Domain of unknown function (DUF4389)
MRFPVTVDVDRASVFQRAHVVLRVALLVVIGWIPNLIVLAIVAFVGAIVRVIAAVLVLVGERYPESIWRFLLGIVRWEACVLAYLASLVDRYPPFMLETASVSPAAPPSQG